MHRETGLNTHLVRAIASMYRSTAWDTASSIPSGSSVVLLFLLISIEEGRILKKEAVTASKQARPEGK